jgi:small subunit ribosomal protein S21
MYIVQIRKGEELDIALKRLKSKVLMDGLMDDLYRLRAFENPREKKKRKLKLSHKKQKLMSKRA